jgi:hypothetical protein
MEAPVPNILDTTSYARTYYGYYNTAARWLSCKYIYVNKMCKIDLLDLICIGGSNWKPTQNSRQWI